MFFERNKFWELEQVNYLIYSQPFNIRRNLGSKIVDHLHVGSAPTTS